MKSPSRYLGLALLPLALTLAGCTTFSAGPTHFQTRYNLEVGVGGYTSTREIRSWDAEIIQIDVLSKRAQRGEVINVDVWPLVGVGVGPLGVRGHLLMFGGGVGGLFYIPHSVGGQEDRDSSFRWPWSEEDTTQE